MKNIQAMKWARAYLQLEIQKIKWYANIKGIKSQYIKSHPCGILVHEIGLYCYVWIDTYHKHNSNHVVTSIMKVLYDVKRRQSKLPPLLCIQENNCWRKNKNIYTCSVYNIRCTLIFQRNPFLFLFFNNWSHSYKDWFKF